MDEKIQNIKKDAGFTLMEMMVVVSIIAIGAAVCTFTLRLTLPDIRLKAAVRDCKSDLNLAKLTAIRQDTFVTITYNAAGDSYTMFLDDGGGNPLNEGNRVQDAGENTIKTVNMPNGIDLYNAAFGALTNVMYNQQGLPSGATGVVEMSSNKPSFRRVSCSLLGISTIQTSPDGATSWTNVP